MRRLAADRAVEFKLGTAALTIGVMQVGGPLGRPAFLRYATHRGCPPRVAFSGKLFIPAKRASAPSLSAPSLLGFRTTVVERDQISGLLAIDSVSTTMLRRSLSLGSFAKAFSICTA